MTWLAVWLVGVGLADLVRAGGRPRAVRGSIVVGVLTVALLAAAAGLTAPVDLVVLAASVVCLGLWVRLSTQSMTTGTGHWPALAALAGGAVLLVGLSGWASPADGPSWSPRSRRRSARRGPSRRGLGPSCLAGSHPGRRSQWSLLRHASRFLQCLMWIVSHMKHCTIDADALQE